MGSLIRATNLWGYVDLVHELGGEPESLLARFHIPSGVEREDDAFVAFDSFVRLLEASAAELGCADFGLRLSRWQGMDILGPVAVIARNAQSVREGFESIGRYLYVHSPALKLEIGHSAGGDDLELIYQVTESALVHLRQGYELSMGNGIQILHLLGGPEATPTSVSFMHEQLGPDAAYADTLGCPVRFEQSWCGFELPNELAARQIDGAHPETRRIAAAYLESQHLPSTAMLTEHVAQLTRRLLPTGNCTAAAIADQLALHPRTLQRRLAEEGVGCQDIIERERRELAVKYLAEPGLHLSQIAGLLGYAEQSTLNRSCRRWYGKTPRQLRSDLT